MRRARPRLGLDMRVGEWKTLASWSIERCWAIVA
jgi:hypothetical protein